MMHTQSQSNYSIACIATSVQCLHSFTFVVKCLQKIVRGKTSFTE